MICSNCPNKADHVIGNVGFCDICFKYVWRIALDYFGKEELEK